MHRPKPTISTAEVADGTVLLDEATGTYYHLNRAGALVYQVLRAGGTVEEAARELASAYQTTEADTLPDAEEFAAELVRHGLTAQ